MTVDDIRLRHQAVAYHREQARLHEMLVGKELLNLRRQSLNAWRELMTNPPIPASAIRKYVRAAQQLEEAAATVR